MGVFQVKMQVEMPLFAQSAECNYLKYLDVTVVKSQQNAFCKEQWVFDWTYALLSLLSMKEPWSFWRANPQYFTNKSNKTYYPIFPFFFNHRVHKDALWKQVKC